MPLGEVPPIGVVGSSPPVHRRRGQRLINRSPGQVEEGLFGNERGGTAKKNKSVNIR